MPSKLDNTDLGILYLLQKNARDNTTTEIGEKIGVSSSTVANRIQKLEEQGIIEGYHPVVNYERAGFENHFVLFGSVPFEDQDTFVENALNVDGVVNTREFLTTHENLIIEVVAPDRKAVEETVLELKNLGLEVEKIQVVSREHDQPFDHFGKHVAGEG